jgi:hypothetical protein
LTEIPESTRALDDARGSAELFPVYQATVFAEPFTSEVAFAVMLVPPAAAIVVLPGAKPNAASAACAFGSEDEAVIEKLATLGVLIETAPPVIEDGVVVPVIESIADSRLPTVPVVGLML